jgi:molecular chaperone GrpE (heat shock protein)
MDEGPQVSVTGTDAVTDADAGADAGEPAAGVVSDATAAETSTLATGETQPDTLASGEPATEEPAAEASEDPAVAIAERPPPDEPAVATAERPPPDEPAVATAERPPPDEPPVATAQQPPPHEPAAATAESPPPQEPAATAETPQPQEPASAETLPINELAEILTALSALGGRVDDLANATAELSRLRFRDTDLIARLHEDVTRLRTGEIAIALNPVVIGMIKLHDQMVSLGALDDPASPVGMLRTQLLQIMELTCAVKPFTPAPGERFDASRHTGVRRIPTTDASADGTIASTLKAGFARADGSIVRVAEVEVHRLSG